MLCLPEGRFLPAFVVSDFLEPCPAGGGFACRQVPPSGRVTFFWWPRRKSPKKRAWNATPFGSFFALGPLAPPARPSVIKTKARLQPALPWLAVRFAAWVLSMVACRSQRSLDRKAAREPGQCVVQARAALMIDGLGGGDTCLSAKNEPNGFAFEALCFGYFHLGQQMKVTRPPGRDPAW